MKSTLKRNGGSVAILMSVILAAVTLLVFVLADATAIQAAARSNDIAVDTALESVLAGYNGTLAADYGIYGIDTKSTANTIAADFQRYYSANMKGTGGRKPVLLECDLSGFGSVVSVGSTEASILQYMRYRAPVYLAEGLVRNINLTGIMDTTMNFTDKAQPLADTFVGVKDKAQIVGELSDLFRIGAILADIAFLKASISADMTALVPDLLITADTRSSAAEYDNDIFGEMAADRGLPDLSAAAGFFRKIRDALKDSGDLIYLASYVMEKFDCYGSPAGRYLSGGETEYILYGADRKADNISRVMDRIYLMRFLIGTGDAFVKYKDYDPRVRLVLSVISGTIGAADELQRLYGGGEISATPGIDNLKLDYKDHLMILLLAELAFDRDGVLGRIQNVIQVNLMRENPDFRMADYTSSLRADMKVSTDTIFLKFAGLGRYITKKTVYKGYR